MKIKDYQLGDEIAILDLFEIVFQQKLNSENWIWRFRDNPAGKHLIKLMWDNDKLIGHYAVSPLVMSVEGQDVLTALSLTTMTHPDYQGKGIFSKLSMALYEDLEDKLNCRSIWGFPNNNSHYGFVKKLAWKNLAVMHTLALNYKFLKPKEIQLSCKEISCFNASHEDFITRKLIENTNTYTKPGVAYLNWRFVNKPNSTYKCYEFDSDSGKSVLVVKPYRVRNSSKYILNIIFCVMDNYEEIHDIIHYINQDLNYNFEKATIWKSLWDPNHLNLERQRFVPELPQTYIAARIHDSMPDSFLDFRNWNISMSDSDVF